MKQAFYIDDVVSRQYYLEKCDVKYHHGARL